MSTIKIMVFLLLIIGYLNVGFAMRCQQSLVFKGDSKYLVEKKCGEPLRKEVYDNPEVIFNQQGAPVGAVSNTYEVWIYQQSPNDFLYKVEFMDGVVTSISADKSL